MATNETIPWAKPEFWGNERRYVLEALNSHWISSGPFVQRLENEFAAYNRTTFALAVSNGTAALQLAYMALGIQPGDEIIVPGFAFMAAANVALQMNAVTVFADVDPCTWCVTAADVERRLSSRTKAIVPVHTYGNVCAMDDIMTLASRRRIPVIEDAAEAFGSAYRGRLAGTFGTVGTYSLHAAKTITTGEGGMVVTASEELKERMSLIRNQGMGRLRYWHDVLGNNFRLTDLQAAFGCAQLEHIKEIIVARQEVFHTYQRYLSKIGGIELQKFSELVEPVPWVVAIKLDPEVYPQGRDKVMLDMQAAGIETRPGFYTPTKMSHLYKSEPLPVADEVSEWTLVLPSFPSLNEEQIKTVCSNLKRLCR
jgi:perosamine synthetase